MPVRSFGGSCLTRAGQVGTRCPRGLQEGGRFWKLPETAGTQEALHPGVSGSQFPSGQVLQGLFSWPGSASSARICRGSEQLEPVRLGSPQPPALIRCWMHFHLQFSGLRKKTLSRRGAGLSPERMHSWRHAARAVGLPGTLLHHPRGVWPPGSWWKAGILEGAPDTPALGAQTPVTQRSSCFPWDTVWILEQLVYWLHVLRCALVEGDSEALDVMPGFWEALSRLWGCCLNMGVGLVFQAWTRWASPRPPPCPVPPAPRVRNGPLPVPAGAVAV